MKGLKLYKRCIVRVLLSLIAYHLSLITSSAQTFTQRVQQTSTTGARITIHQDADIDKLVNGTAPATVQPQQPRQNNTQTNRQTANRQTTRNERQERTQENTPAQVASADSIAQTSPRRYRKVNGFRVQPFVGGKTRADRVKAEQAGSTLQGLFPGQKVYVHFLGGHWTCRLGDFQSAEEAREVLNQVVKLGYDTAILVRGKVNIPY